MADRITAPDANRPILDSEGNMEQAFRSWANNLTRLSLITGEGSPEGVVPADRGADYMDTIGTTGNIKYIKRDSDIAGDKSQGWILV